IFGPVLAVTTFKTMEEALELANDTQYGLGAGVWSRNGNLAYKMGRGIQAGRVWTNCYHAYPAHAILRIVRQLQRFFHRFEGGH
ncbi:aldehyde dehydrogenase family protein, partial [Escherichia sp. TWPC-MK]